METSLPVIYADFNNADRHGRLRLAICGSEEDIQRQDLKLFDGMKVIVKGDDLSADAEVKFSNEEQIWVAEINWAQIKRQPKT
jgi:hypothetical protein